jgi:putative ABC transport system permease protein
MGADKMSGISRDGPRRPPFLGRWLLSRILPSRLKSTAAGDFEELYRRTLSADGPRQAAVWYWRQVVKSMPAFFFAAVYWRLAMIGNYLKLTLRHARRRPEFAAVNIGGLAVGLAGCILAFFFIRDEFAFDRFHSHVERIYEVKSKIRVRDNLVFKETMGPVGPTLAADFGEVEAATRLAKADVVVRAGENAFLRNGLGIDPSFFKVFNFPLVRGNSASALRDPYSVVLGRETARMCFGVSDPLGQTLSIKIRDETADYVVKGVLREIPARSSLDFDLLLPISRVKGPMIDQWSAGPNESPVDAACFIRLREGADAEALAAKFPDTLDKHLSADGNSGCHYLFPFAEYHRGVREYSYSLLLKPRSSPLFSYLLTSIAVLVLLIAGFNFMNLTIGAAASDRVKEIGLRKVFGAERKNLFHQFQFEGIMMSLAALAGGIGLASLVLPAFNRFAGKDLHLDLLGAGRPLFALILLAVFVGAAAGSYPGWFLTRPRPMELFRGAFFLGRKGGFSRVFLIFQFGISIFLVITTCFLYRQHRYLLRSDLGYDTDRVAVLDLRQLSPRFQSASRFLPVLKSRLLRHPEIQAVSGSDSDLSSWSAQIIKRETSSKPELVRFNTVDPDFLAVLGLRMSEGQWFSPEVPSEESNAVIVNETFARLYAPSQPVGKNLSEIIRYKSPVRIIGVVRDFHFDSLRSTIQPAMIRVGTGFPRWAYIRLTGKNLPRAMDIIEKEFKTAAPGLPFLYSFLDEKAARQYEKEALWSRMIGIVSLFAVLIACSGVFALAIQSSVRKRKEIGIRKVMGASLRQILALLNGEFVKAAAAAALIAWPAAFVAVRKILAGYPYRISPSPWIFAAGSITIILLIVLTVSLQAFRAARTDPAETLRSE